MTTIELILSILILVLSCALILLVLLQQGKAHNLSGVIAGGAETFFGKSKANTMNKKLSIATTIIAIVFAVAVAAFYIMQSTSSESSILESLKQALPW